MIKPKKITPYTCEAFDPQEKSLGFLNEYEFNDLRIQIAKEKAEGYYMQTADYKKLPILPNGKIDNWPQEFYDLIENQLTEILKMQK